MITLVIHVITEMIDNSNDNEYNWLKLTTIASTRTVIIVVIVIMVRIVVSVVRLPKRIGILSQT